MAVGPDAGTRWDPHQYLKFADHRLRPALDLLDRVPLESPALIYDLGCGSGHVTRLIAARWPTATVYGLDNSKEMLAQAMREPGPVRWIEADILTWSPNASPDLIYSNATLQWLDGHRSLFPRLLASVKRGGVLAVQMPLSWGAPSHRHMREALANGPDGRSLGTAALRQAAARNWVEPAALYYDLLAPDAAHVDIWETEYLQELTGEDPVLEWVKGTGLRPILNGLQGYDREVFLADYTRRLRMAYPIRADGITLFPFRRLFLIATRR